MCVHVSASEYNNNNKNNTTEFVYWPADAHAGESAFQRDSLY